MTESIDALVELRLRQAWEDLAVAKKLCDGETPARIIINRLYYACFYAVCALLAARGLDQSKHSGVRSQFGRHFIRTGEFEVELGKFFNRIFDARMQSDYEERETVIAEADLVAWIGAAENLINRIDQYLKSR